MLLEAIHESLLLKRQTPLKNLQKSNEKTEYCLLNLFGACWLVSLMPSQIAFCFWICQHTVFIRLSKKKDKTHLIRETAWPCWPCAETEAYRIGVLIWSRGNCGGSYWVPPYEHLLFLSLLLAYSQFVVFLLLNLSSFKSIPFIECCCTSTYC